ncbi:GNAT superfamily N-acetyltransferase [Phycicoccus badiiscoriae]|uniref:GNAT superfamily N-acetyltransferase n=1 Tax=Pedococcus badiiscoriae TaxID=642776 RepID=A0A852WQV0_9MICO|nr:GNAT family N-acetyltransferase [Pedococcus badiiscoriae]NYG08585.1 GNAT superfamily N-acetyltransferase [Pedococcus badiiscoriae]
MREQVLEVVVRERTTQDIPVLAEVLAAQQPVSGYPQNWPLPFPVESFIARADEDAAWVAELDGRVVGHVAVSRVEPGLEADLWTAGTGRPRTELAAVAVLFVDPEVGGRGVGKALLATAVSAIRASRRVPVLDVVQETASAVELYRRSGWRVVGEGRPWWLPDDHLPVLFMALPD